MSSKSPTSILPSPWPKMASTHESVDGVRKRVRKACDRCRMKKTKCDGSSPCLRCRTDNVICCSKEGQKLRRRSFPKGYAEMLEKQHNQLVCGLQEMYRRLQKASLWEGEPLDESSGRPLTHDILAVLNLLEPHDGDADFNEQPRSIHMLEEPDDDDDDQKTPADSSQEVSHPTPHGRAVVSVSDAAAHTTKSRSSIEGSSRTPPGPRQPPSQPPSQPRLQSATPLDSPSHLPPVVSQPIQPDFLWDDPLYSFDDCQSPSVGSNLDSSDWDLVTPILLPPLMTELPVLYHDDTSGGKRPPVAPRPSLCHDWLGNGIAFDSSDFMSDFHQLSPQETRPLNIAQPKTAGPLS